MKGLFIAGILAVAMQSAQAEIADDVDRLTTTKTAAENGVIALKFAFAPARREYKIGQEKYTAAENAYNNYTRALLSSYKVNTEINLNDSAKLAALRAEAFQKYVSSLRLETKSPIVILAAVGVLIEIGEKFYTYVKTLRQEERVRFADTIAPQITWNDWDKVRAN